MDVAGDRKLPGRTSACHGRRLHRHGCVLDPVVVLVHNLNHGSQLPELTRLLHCVSRWPTIPELLSASDALVSTQAYFFP